MAVALCDGAFGCAGERSLYRALERLKSSRRIERIGGKRYGHWEVHE